MVVKTEGENLWVETKNGACILFVNIAIDYPAVARYVLPYRVTSRKGKLFWGGGGHILLQES